MSQDKRAFLQASTLAAVTTTRLPLKWVSGCIFTVSLPAHAMTSASAECSGFSEEPVDEAIDITVTETQVIGPVVATFSGTSFSEQVETTNDGCDSGSQLLSVVQFSGALDLQTDSISGTFNVTQSCAGQIQCEQLAEYSVTKVSGAAGEAIGEYRGRVVGVLRCCNDLV